MRILATTWFMSGDGVQAVRILSRTRDFLSPKCRHTSSRLSSQPSSENTHFQATAAFRRRLRRVRGLLVLALPAACSASQTHRSTVWAMIPTRKSLQCGSMSQPHSSNSSRPWDLSCIEPEPRRIPSEASPR